LVHIFLNFMNCLSLKISTVDPLLSGKLLVVDIMLKELQSSSSIGKQEKIILVSYYTKVGGNNLSLQSHR